MIASIGVFCGSSFGTNPAYTDAARALGALLGRERITLVYGGGKIGLMGVLADAALASGGKVIGVIPQSLLDREVGHVGLTDLRVVRDMSERKTLMAELADAFIAMPGGIGTLDELFEVWTWTQLGYHDKPCGLLNVADYFDPLIEFLDRATEQGFLRLSQRALLSVRRTPESLLEELGKRTKSTRKP